MPTGEAPCSALPGEARRAGERVELARAPPAAQPRAGERAGERRRPVKGEAEAKRSPAGMRAAADGGEGVAPWLPGDGSANRPGDSTLAGAGIAAAGASMKPNRRTGVGLDTGARRTGAGEGCCAAAALCGRSKLLPASGSGSGDGCASEAVKALRVMLCGSGEALRGAGEGLKPAGRTAAQPNGVRYNHRPYRSAATANCSDDTSIHIAWHARLRMHTKF